MYRQILKEILFIIDFGQSHIEEFLIYSREQFGDTSAELKHIDIPEKEYFHRQLIC
jgi:hypothetical protein